MALVKTNLAYLGGAAPGPRLWSYKTTDTAATVDTEGYFNGVAAQLNVGDFIFLHATSGGTPQFGVVVVLSNDGSVVDTGDMVALKSADTD